MPTKYLGFTSRKVKLLLAGIDPHVTGTPFYKGVPSETQDISVKISGNRLIGDKQIHVF